MTGSLATRTLTSPQRRSIRWFLQAVLVLVAVHVTFLFLVSTVIPLVLDSPVRVLSTSRGRYAGLAGRILSLVAVGAPSSFLGAGFSTIMSDVLATATQTVLVFAVAHVVSRMLTRHSVDA